MISRRTMLQSLAAAAVLGAAPKSPVIGFAAGTYGMKMLSTQEALRTIAEIGYDGVEPCLIPGWPMEPAKLSAPDRRTLRSLLDETVLAVPALLESLSITGVPAKRATNLDRLKRAIDLGNELAPSNPPVIDSTLGGKSVDWEKLKGPMADELHAWARVGEDSKTTVCFKPHAGEAVNSPERTLWLLKEVGSPRIRIIYDYSHFYLEGFSLASSLKQLLPYTAFISVKDAAGTAAKPEYLLPGDGKTDYLEYFRLLKELRYSGFVGVEVSAMIQRKPDYQPVPAARLCYDRLAPLFARAGVARPVRRRAG
jgi:sugar phosphate isomerase/epimerase